MGVTFLPDRNRFLRGPSSGDADVTAWAASVVTNGGTVSAGRVALVGTLVAAWKAAGTWALIDDAWLLVAENAPQALTSLKQRRLAVANNSPTFSADQGYAFNGTTQYIDTGFVPNTHKVAMASNNMHIAVYERTDVGTTSVAAGAINTSLVNLQIIPRNASSFMAVQLSNQVSGGGDTISDSRGLWVGSRNGTLSTDVLAYKNGVAVMPNPPGATSASLVTQKIFIGAQCNNTAVAVLFRAATEGFVSVGAAIPAGQQPGFYSAVQAHMTALGANV